MITHGEANSSELIGISDQQDQIFGLASNSQESLQVVRLRTQRKQVFRVLLGDNLLDHYLVNP